MHVAATLGCSDRHASLKVSEAQAPEGGSCLHGCLEYCASAYRSLEVPRWEEGSDDGSVSTSVGYGLHIQSQRRKQVRAARRKCSPRKLYQYQHGGSIISRNDGFAPPRERILNGACFFDGIKDGVMTELQVSALSPTKS